MFIFILAQWPCRDRFCSERMPTLGLWLPAIALRLDFTWFNTQNRWHSVDTLLMLCWCSVDNLLTLCGRSFWGIAVSPHTILPIKAANTSIMGKCHITALGLYKMQHPNSLTLCSRSFSELGCDHFAVSFAHKGCRYVDYNSMRKHSPWIIQDATLKIVDTLLTLCRCSVDAMLKLCWRFVDAHFQVKRHRDTQYCL